MSNVIDMPTPMSVLAERIKASYENAVKDRNEWVSGTLELAANLDEARARFPSESTSAYGLLRTNSTGSAKVIEPHCSAWPMTLT
jgi:hypothetical protein